MEVRDPIVELKETRLYRALANVSAEYAERIARFVGGIAPILATTEHHFPYYTRHDAHHGFRVVRRIGQVVLPSTLDPDDPNAFAAAELFLLIAAAYAHDLGMTVFPGEANGLLRGLRIDQSAGWETSNRLQVHLRREHSRRGGEYIRVNAAELGVPQNLLAPLDLMMRAHNLSIAELEALNAPHAAEERPIDLRQLAAVVCIGDALEFSDTRVIEGVLDRIKVDPSDAARVSYRENMKHICIGDSLAISDARVVVSGSFGEESVLALAHETLDQVEEWVRGYVDIDRRSRWQRLGIKAEPFERTFAFAGGRFERLGVRLNKRSVIDLIASNAVWRSNPGIAIRELMQNAVEACRYRQHHSSPSDRYAPAVRVEFDRTSGTIVVEDNGCGMTERVVLNNLLTVGSSRSKEAGYAGRDYDPIARFGIGFWSVFTIAKTALVETASFEGSRGSPDVAASAVGVSFAVSLEELKDYTVFRSTNRPCGTRIQLVLREGVALDEVYARSRGMLLCSEVPVTLVLDGEEVKVPFTAPDVSIASVVGTRTQLLRDGSIQLFRWRGERGDTTLALALAHRLVDGKASFLATPGKSLLGVLGGHRTPSTSVCGFTVPVRPGQLCIDLFRVGTLVANHRSPRGFEFTLDRQQLQPNDALLRFTQDIMDLAHEGYRTFLEETNSRDPLTISALHGQACMHGGNVFDVFTGAELCTAASHFADLLVVRLHPVTIDEPYRIDRFIYYDLQTLQSKQGTVYTLQTRSDVPHRGAMSFTFEPEDPHAVQVVHDQVREWTRMGTVSGPAYVMEPNRLGSMLFDNDPDSTLQFFDVGQFKSLPLQVLRLDRVVYGTAADVLAEVQGRWAGGLYLRDFNAPNGKPYVFLGRHRVVVKRSSRLANHLQDLARSGRLVRLSETIADLKEDEAGFTPEGVRNLLQVEREL